MACESSKCVRNTHKEMSFEDRCKLLSAVDFLEVIFKFLKLGVNFIFVNCFCCFKNITGKIASAEKDQIRQ